MFDPVDDDLSDTPTSLREVAVRVESRLDALFDRELERWTALDESLAEPLLALQSLVMAGGKRLRPAFCFWGFVGADGDADDPRVIDAGAAFEMLQAFALVHDDIMDGSATRRGLPTAHLRFSRAHVDASWRGEDRRFGEGVAILIGDLAHVYADAFMRSAPAAALEIWDELRIELNVGQYLDMHGGARGDVDIDGARLIARYKSGKYTIERPLHVGAGLTGRLGELLGHLSAYGDPLGEAFQLRDDMLGAFGETDQTGKPVGDDLREGKPTPLLAVARSRADDEQRLTLNRVGDPALTDGDIATIQQVLIATGAVDAIEAAIDDLTDRALDALGTAPVTAPARESLDELARFVAWRSA